MKVAIRRNKQSGVALLLAIVALLLLTAAGLALLFSSDAETDISVNYRDKQVAVYAAMAGLQEARDRIHPKTGDLALAGKVPTVLPAASASTANSVLYIINPSDGETVAPWDPANPYFDTELCHERILGMTAPASPNLPCDPTNPAQVPPSSSGWRIVVDNSSTSTPWKLGAPLGYKWVRVTLKADNMTPATVGKVANGTQVCWTGSHEQQMVDGYTAACAPKKDKITNISVTNAGSGYPTPPTVTIAPPGGSGVTAQAVASVAQMTEGVTSAHITDGGKGYTSASAPKVYIAPVDGNGAGADVTAQVGSPVTSVGLTTSGVPPCYQDASPLQLSFDAKFGSGASGSVNKLSGTRCIYSFSATGDCGHSEASPITVTATGGFSGTLDLLSTNKKVISTSGKVTNPGNFTTPPSPTAYSAPSSCSGFTVTPIYGYQVDTSTAITTSNGISNGGLYSSAPTVQLVGGVVAGGSGTITGTSTLQGGSTADEISALTVVASGSGYTANPTLTIDPPSAGGRQATGWASITPDSGVSGIAVTNQGSGYTSAPTVTLSPPNAGGVQATAIATLGGGGASFGAVYLLTSMAQSKAGARAMIQMEVGETFSNFTMSLGGALTLAGPSPSFGSPMSSGYMMVGTDSPTSGPQPSTCDGKASAAKPAIGVYDDPNNPTTPSSVNKVTQALGKQDNYIGIHSAPDIENVFDSLGNPTPDGLNAFVQSVAAVATNTYSSDPGTKLNFGTAANPAIDYIDGDLTLSGNTTGYGILVVTGTLKLNGDYHWNGLVLVIGKGASVMKGGGNGQINGSVFVANTQGGSPPGTALGSPNVDWAGGGGNGIQYNHCWADDMLAKVPFTPPPSPNPLQIISVRILDM